MTTTLVSNELFSGCVFRLDVHSLQIIVHIAIYIYKMVILLLSSMLILTNTVNWTYLYLQLTLNYCLFFISLSRPEHSVGKQLVEVACSQLGKHHTSSTVPLYKVSLIINFKLCSSTPGHHDVIQQPQAICSHPCASVVKQYNLVLL